MKNLFKLLLIVFCFVVISCSNDDNASDCAYRYNGHVEKVDNRYYVYYNSTNVGKEENVEVSKEIYEWIMRGDLKSGDCFDVDKYKIVK